MISFFGVPVLFSSAALKETTERLFPFSRHRSARIRKKLVKRFGGEFYKQPAMFQLVGVGIVCHPALRGALREVESLEELRSIDSWG